MSAYTEADLQAVQAAILALATGKRRIRVKIKNREIEYSPANLADLDALEGRIKSALNGGPRIVRVQTSKGLG